MITVQHRFILALLSLASLPISGDQFQQNVPFNTPEANSWAQIQLETMTLDQKLGQLFMVAAYSNKGEEHEKFIDNLVSKYHIGGLIFFQGGPVRQARLTNRYQRKAKTPLMIAMDAEWGLNMRLDSTVRYPWQMTMGAIQNEDLVYDMGKDLALQCQRLGVHINFAPVVDVNSNPQNPIINRRSFGENKLHVAKLGAAYMNGMQDQHILACAKHFPGHGDTDSDSHKSLPIINHDLKRLKEVELYPFSQLIAKGIGSMMVAHLYIPSLDTTTNLASTLSPKIVTDLLKKEMQFSGLIFTDALNMKGVSKYFAPGEVDLKAFQAGNDVLLFPEDVPKAISVFKESLNSGLIHLKEVDARVLKILKSKHWMGLSTNKYVELDNLYEDLNKLESQLLVKKMTEASITVVRNKNSFLPIKDLQNKSIAVVSIGGDNGDVFQNRLKQYTDVKRITVPQGWSLESQKAILEQLEGINTLIIGIHKSDGNPWKSYKLTDDEKQLLDWLLDQRRCVVDVFTNPYALIGNTAISKANAIVLSYQNSTDAQDISAQIIFGAKPAFGKVPVSALPLIKEGDGEVLTAIGRLEYGIPEENGIRSMDLDSVGILINNAIENEATPGAQVLVAYKGKVIYNEAFGFHTYNKMRPVRKNHIYDLASITKISASVPLLMQLQGAGFFNLNKTLGDYLNNIAPDKKALIIKDILAHKSGLASWIPFYLNVTENGVPRNDLFSHYSKQGFRTQVAGNIFIKDSYVDSVYARIDSSEIAEHPEYKYSDLGYYFLRRIIEQQTGKSMQQSISERFAAPLGATTLGYKPLERYYIGDIVPTEQDSYFRNQLLQGYVHDPGAAMLGGVGGHAGMFSNANDLAKMMQMYLQNGYYGGRQFINPAVIQEYTAYQDVDTTNRRGAGFDKKMRCCGGGGSCCEFVSASSFGHSGFTGTLVWVDPEMELVYVFLSNRVYPDASNMKLIKDNVRTEIQRIIYKSLPVNIKLAIS